MLALLTHTVLTAGVTTEIRVVLLSPRKGDSRMESAHRGTDAELRLPAEGCRVSPEICPMSSGYAHSGAYTFSGSLPGTML